MVKVTEHEHILADGNIDLEGWLQHLGKAHNYQDLDLIRNACILTQLSSADRATDLGKSCLQQGLAMAEILSDLDMGQYTLAASIVYNSVEYAELTIDDVREQLGDTVAKLVEGVRRMDIIPLMQHTAPTHSRQQIDNLRKMLLAMVDDVRVVVIKLAERLSVLRSVAKLSDGLKRQLAKETMVIYAPLANRLGIGQIKWEMEDLAFRYIEPDTYKKIASGLNVRRVERDNYVTMIVGSLKEKVRAAGIRDFQIEGRAKHIHSIHRKMTRKDVPLSEIYDAIAVRVLARNIEDCYAVLSIVHTDWEQIPEEFDDYISNTKPNGYQSLHTAVIGPEQRNFEVQIRTYDMHDFAELGVAAHWRYKEGSGQQKQSHENKIEWLREVLAWQHETAAKGESLEDIEREFLDERIYVFTPNGDIVDLPSLSTPLDFAYHIHSEVGHRCRGAKIDDHIVPLTYQLKTGDQVEILTAKEGKPTRDWLNPHLGYVTSSRARAKIHHWFKLQDFEHNIGEGREIMDRELRKLHLKTIDYDKLATYFNMSKGENLLAALGSGDISLGQLLNTLQHKMLGETPEKTTPDIPISRPHQQGKPADININGVGDLLTYIAQCCRPLPGDDIIGYITQGKGVSIHRRDCSNILHTTESMLNRLIEVDWGDNVSEKSYPVEITIEAYDRQGLLRDLTQLLVNQKASILSLTTATNKSEHSARLFLVLEVTDLSTLSKIIDKIMQVSNVISAERTKDT